jgi:hypothetical protein
MKRPTTYLYLVLQKVKKFPPNSFSNQEIEKGFKNFV